MSQRQVFLYAQAPISIDQMESIGPGDEDVNTKSGRQTYVAIKTSDPFAAQSRREIVVHLDYLIQERAKDYTTLSARAVATISLESGMTFVSFGAGMRPANYATTIHGQQHDWIDISTRQGIAGSILSHCKIKIDGRGKDNRGNARLNAHLTIPLVANVRIENPASGGQTNEGTDMLEPLSLSELRVLEQSNSPKFVEIIKGQRPVDIVVASTKVPKGYVERMRMPD